MNSLSRYFHTVKDLKTVQIITRLKKQFFKPDFKKIRTRDFSFDPPDLKVDFIKTSCIKGGKISFLNKSLSLDDFFTPSVYRSFLMLEQFTLHYMDFLLDPAFNKNTAKAIAEFYENNTDLPCAFAPYVVSLRLVNWLKVSHSHVFDRFTLSHLEKLGQYIGKHREYDVLGNHLLKNIKAMIFYHIYFNHDQLQLARELDLLRVQLKEQILPDGWHFERTPSYHLIVLEDLLDIYNILSGPVSDKIKKTIEDVIFEMLAVALSWPDEYPLLNDSSYWSARTPQTIKSYAESLGFQLPEEKHSLYEFPDAGYFAYFRPGFTLWIDAGDLGPKYLPGHAHNDSLSFILYVNGTPLFTDTGTCSYQDITLRDIVRSARSHNTVIVDNTEPSDFWRSFRYGRKVRLCERKVFPDRLHAEISYSHKRHKRVWEIHDESVNILDVIDGYEGIALFHLAEGCEVDLDENDRRASIEKPDGIVAELISENPFELGESLYCPNINDVRKRKVLSVKFARENNAEIIIK